MPNLALFYFCCQSRCFFNFIHPSLLNFSSIVIRAAKQIYNIADKNRDQENASIYFGRSRTYDREKIRRGLVYMMRRMLFYVVELFIVAFFVSWIIINALEYATYGFLAILFIAPIFGAMRMKKNWKVGLSFLFKMARIRRMSVKSLLVGIIVILVLYKVILSALAYASLLALGGAVTMYAAWEVVRIGLNKWKSIRLVSFLQAFKSAW